ncbi:MAG: aldo/keto reductase, partial [Conexivisphaera sp.]
MKEIGRTGMRVPPIGIGTWRIGGGSSPDYGRDREMAELIAAGIRMGMWLIDTAEFYGGGHTEEIVGRALGIVGRENAFVVSKVWYTHLDRESLRRSAEASLRRLGTDHFDLYLVHWPNPGVPLCETMRAMEDLVREGRALSIGVSNFDRALLEEARACLSRADVAADEVKYNVYERDAERELLPYCEREGITLIAYTPLAKGRVSRDPLLVEIGSKYGRTAAQVALNWLILHGPVVAIPKASVLEHMRENAGGMGWSLSREDFELISRSAGRRRWAEIPSQLCQRWETCRRFSRRPRGGPWGWSATTTRGTTSSVPGGGDWRAPPRGWSAGGSPDGPRGRAPRVCDQEDEGGQGEL